MVQENANIVTYLTHTTSLLASGLGTSGSNVIHAGFSAGDYCSTSYFRRFENSMTITKDIRHCIFSVQHGREALRASEASPGFIPQVFERVSQETSSKPQQAHRVQWRRKEN